MSTKDSYWSSICSIYHMYELVKACDLTQFEQKAENWLPAWDQHIAGVSRAPPGRHTLSQRYIEVRRLATSLAMIGCEDTGPEDVFACCIEQDMTNTHDPNTPTFIIRIARNKMINQKDIEKFQNFIDIIVSNVLSTKMPQKGTTDYDKIVSEQISIMLKLVATRCAKKINALYQNPLKDWMKLFTDRDRQILQSASDPLMAIGNEALCYSILDSLKSIADSDKSLAGIIESIRFAYKISRVVTTEVEEGRALSFETLLAPLDAMWKQYETGELLKGAQEVYGANDEDDTQDANDTKHSSVYRLINKLSRYKKACVRILNLLLKWHGKGVLREGMFKVKTISGFRTTASASSEVDHLSFESYLHSLNRSGLTMKHLSKEVVKPLSSKWRHEYNMDRFLHCEIQLTLFYLLNDPKIIPLGYFIGVSKYCCKYCAKVLKKLAEPSEGFKAYEFVAAGTHGKFVANWLFPDLDLLATTHEVSHEALTAPFDETLEDRLYFQHCEDDGCDCPSINIREYKCLSMRLHNMRANFVRILRKTVIAGLERLHKDYDVPSNWEGLSEISEDPSKSEDLRSGALDIGTMQESLALARAQQYLP